MAPTDLRRRSRRSSRRPWPSSSASLDRSRRAADVVRARDGCGLRAGSPTGGRGRGHRGRPRRPLRRDERRRGGRRGRDERRARPHRDPRPDPGAIAAEKAGIIKPGSLVVVGEREPEIVGDLRGRGRARRCSVRLAARARTSAASRNRLAYGGRVVDLRTPSGDSTTSSFRFTARTRGTTQLARSRRREAFFGTPLERGSSSARRSPRSPCRATRGGRPPASRRPRRRPQCRRRSRRSAERSAEDFAAARPGRRRHGLPARPRSAELLDGARPRAHRRGRRLPSPPSPRAQAPAKSSRPRRDRSVLRRGVADDRRGGRPGARACWTATISSLVTGSLYVVGAARRRFAERPPACPAPRTLPLRPDATRVPAHEPHTRHLQARRRRTGPRRRDRRPPRAQRAFASLRGELRTIDRRDGRAALRRARRASRSTATSSRSSPARPACVWSSKARTTPGRSCAPDGADQPGRGAARDDPRRLRHRARRRTSSTARTAAESAAAGDRSSSSPTRLTAVARPRSAHSRRTLRCSRLAERGSSTLLACLSAASS